LVTKPAVPGYRVLPKQSRKNERAQVSFEEDWVCEAQGRTVIVRVRLDRGGPGITIVRYAVEDGPSQSGLEVSITSREEARQWIQARVDQLLGPMPD